VVNRRFEDTGWLLGLLGGYQVKCNRWLLGVEVNVDWQDIFDDNEDDNLAFSDASPPVPGLLGVFGQATQAWNASSKFERDWVVGLSGRMGYEITPYLMPYIRLGLEWSEDELSYIQTNNSNTVSISADGDRDGVRVLAGIGLEVPVPTVNGLTVRAEYDYHRRGRRVEAVNVINGGFLVNASRDPTAQTAILSVVWNI
jgi:opacity protein-like surface antigen